MTPFIDSAPPSILGPTLFYRAGDPFSLMLAILGAICRKRTNNADEAAASFERRRLLSAAEYRVFKTIDVCSGRT
jgi:hypothetical protein